MVQIENTNEAEWDAVHEWIDEWVKSNKLNPDQVKSLLKNSPEMLKSLKAMTKCYGDLERDIGDQMAWDSIKDFFENGEVETAREIIIRTESR